METINITPDFLENRPLSYSSLKEFAKSPKNYIMYLLHKTPPTPSQLEGKYLDTLLLEPHMVEKRFIVYDKFDRRSNAAKEAWDQLETRAQKENKILVTSETVRGAKMAVEAIMDNADAKNVIENIKKVQTRLKWTDKQTGLPLIGYSDFETTFFGLDCVFDLKKTQSADPDDFHRDIFKYGYHLQAACYKEGYWKTQYRFPEFFNLAVETNAPYNVSINYYEPKLMQESQDEFRGILLAFKKCMDEGRFTEGYEFRRMDMATYFAINKPGYYKTKFKGFEHE